MFKYVSPSWGNPTPNSKILDISSNKGRQKERRIKTENIYSVAYRSISTRGGDSTSQGKETNVEANRHKTSGG